MFLSCKFFMDYNVCLISLGTIKNMRKFSFLKPTKEFVPFFYF